MAFSITLLPLAWNVKVIPSANVCATANVSVLFATSISVITAPSTKLPLLTAVICIPVPMFVRSSRTTVVELLTAPLTVSLAVKIQSVSTGWRVNIKPNPLSSVVLFSRTKFIATGVSSCNNGDSVEVTYWSECKEAVV